MSNKEIKKEEDYRIKMVQEMGTAMILSTALIGAALVYQARIDGQHQYKVVDSHKYNIAYESEYTLNEMRTR